MPKERSGDVGSRASAAAQGVVGRTREVELVVAALGARRHVVLEGPPGIGKSTLLRSVAQSFGVSFVFVEGNAELTPSRLIGNFDPARVLDEGYAASSFVDGPLVQALREGALLYVEEINRIPEETLNVLVTVMSEGEITIPRYGKVTAGDGFRLVAAMNPFDAVGTARISSAISDRVCRVAMTYQSLDDEVAIVEHATRGSVKDFDSAWVRGVVEVARATRSHPELRVGSSVRGAIDTVMVADQLVAMRGSAATRDACGKDAAVVSLSGRVRVREGVTRSAESIIEELWDRQFAADERDRSGKASAPTGAPSRR
ncbi:MAG: MoxR family ATPase [Actinobacteria bacterium]|nr:MoxR family ATPase [Actinomycetota bacterium]